MFCRDFIYILNMWLIFRRDFVLKKGVKNVFPNQYEGTGLRGLGWCLTSSFSVGFCFCFFCFFLISETSPHLLQLCLRMLQLCFAAKLLKCFVDYETSPDFPLAWGWVAEDRICGFGWTSPLRRWSVHKEQRYQTSTHSMSLNCLIFEWTTKERTLYLKLHVMYNLMPACHPPNIVINR